MKRAPLHLAVMLCAASLALPACTEPCVELADKICGCQPASLQDSCKSEATAESSRVQPTSADQQRCKALIDQCDCNQLATPEGKVACGLARPSP
jgi:hypothetical protein